MKLVQAVLISTVTLAVSFSPSSNIQPLDHANTELFSTQPPYWESNYYGSSSNENQPQSQPGQNTEDGHEGDAASLKANRWSKFAPDTELPMDEFKAQLKENMKADLERRRRESPNRGNQPAKSYLDSL